MASFSLLANYSLVKLNSNKIIKVVTDSQYLKNLQNLSNASFKSFFLASITTFLLNKDIVQPIRQIIHNILEIEIYIKIHEFIIEKQY